MQGWQFDGAKQVYRDWVIIQCVVENYHDTRKRWVELADKATYTHPSIEPMVVDNVEVKFPRHKNIGWGQLGT